jgi:hypothetical protein
VTTSQILTGAGLILALTAGSRVLASRLGIPAIILLPAGFVAGALTTTAVSRGSVRPSVYVIIASAMSWDSSFEIDRECLENLFPPGAADPDVWPPEFLQVPHGQIKDLQGGPRGRERPRLRGT